MSSKTCALISFWWESFAQFSELGTFLILVESVFLWSHILRWYGRDTILWWQFGCKDAWAPVVTDQFGWSVKIKSLHEKLFVCICGGSLRKPIWWSKWVKFLSFCCIDVLTHHEEDLALKSPVITNKVLFYLIQASKRFGLIDRIFQYML